MKLANNCNQCSLRSGAKRIVWGEGPYPASSMLIAEAPGHFEDVHGTPFYPTAKAGMELDRILQSIHLPRQSLYITNLVKCHPPDDRDPKDSEILACGPWVLQEIEKVAPIIIGTVGRVSTRFFLGDVDMETCHGIPHLWEGIIIIPIYHPAAGLRDPKMMMQCWEDFRVFGATVRSPSSAIPVSDPYKDKEDYYLSDADKVLVCLYHDEPSIVAVDTETKDGGPWCLSYSYSPGVAGVIMKDDYEALYWLSLYLSQPHVTTLNHSAAFDLPVLAKMGVFPSSVVDTMVMAYLLQTEPQGLKPLAFRHLGMSMSSYSDMVGEATLSKSILYLEEVSRHEWPDPPLTVVTTKGVSKPKQPQNINRKVKGIFRDLDKNTSTNPSIRWSKIPQEERTPIENKLGPMLPGYLSDIPLQDAIFYSARDADATIRLYPILLTKIMDLGLFPTLMRDMGAMLMVTDMMEAGFPIDKQRFYDLSYYFDRRMSSISDIISEFYAAPINPGSPVQVHDLIYNRLGLKSKIRAKSAFATDDKILADLVHSDSSGMVQNIRDWRSYKKLKSSYSDVIPELADSDNRVHTTLRITRTDTGRLSSSSPNLMAQPVRTREGRFIRDAFLAPPGSSFVSNDYSQVEMRVVAHESQDPEMLKVFRDHLDIHSITASRMFGIPIGALDEMKHRYPAKRVGFGILNDISPQGLYRELIVGGASPSDWSVDECARLIREWFVIYRGVADWRQQVLSHARRHLYVKDMWGRIRWVPGVRASVHYVREESLRQAFNAPIQMGAQGIIKEAMGCLVPIYREFTKQGLIFRPLIQIHDDLVFEIQDDLIPVVVPIIKSVMERVAPFILVPLKVDSKSGKRWGSLTKIKEV